MECLRRHKVGRFVFSSTAATFGVPEKMPITEETPQQPINPYGASKLAVERALADYAHAYQWGFAALRYFNASGAHADGKIGEDHTPETHLIPLIIQAILGQRPHIEIFGADYPTPDGTCVRDYIHVDDLAEAHLLALEKLQAGQQMHYNLGIGRGYSVREVIAAVEAVTGKKVPIKEGPHACRGSAGIGRLVGQDSARAGLDAALHRHQGNRRERVELAQSASEGLQRQITFKPQDKRSVSWGHPCNIMIPQSPLKDRVALVTGAGVGIGRATAALLAQAGATLGLHYHTSQAGAEEVARLIRDAGGQAHLVQGDLTNEADADRVVDQLLEKTGRLDILFNNAGSPDPDTRRSNRAASSIGTASSPSTSRRRSW